MISFYFDYFNSIKKTLDNIDMNTLHEINTLLHKTLENRKKIFTMGNGGSGSTASHLVCDLNKGVNFNQEKKYRAICLNDNLPTISAYANDLSYSDIFSEQLKTHMDKNDLVIGFSGSGNSENILKAIVFANKNQGITIGITGFDGGQLAKIAQFSLVVPIHDMQKCEDIHLILSHLIMQTLIIHLQNR